MVTYAKDIVLGTQSFTCQVDGEEAIVGNADTGVFLAVPAQAAELLQDLASGTSIGEALERYERKYGETPDIDDFLSVLEAKGIIQIQNADHAKDTPLPAALPVRKYHFGNFPQQAAQRLFSAPVLGACFALIAFALLAISRDQRLMPVPRDLVFPDHRSITWAILIAFDLAAIFAHELGHLVAARAQGVKSRMGVSNRLWDLVAETDLTGLWAVPKNKRYLPMLAGILVDAVSGSALIIVELAYENHLIAFSPFALRLVRALAISYLLRMLWECFMFVRTDVYYVIATIFNCKNLLADTEVFLKNQASRFIRRIKSADQSAIPASEMSVIKIYSVIWLAGRIWALLMLFWVTIPISIAYIRDLNHVFRTGYSANPANFADAAFLAAIFLLPTIAGLILWIRGLLIRQRS